ncbi:MAG: hypothetical protein NVS3B27_18980 [Novosphingobium sp.]
MPLTGFHSVIETPDSVSRVIPPTTTMPTINAATAHSQRAIAIGCGWRVDGAAGDARLAMMAAALRPVRANRKLVSGA